MSMFGGGKPPAQPVPAAAPAPRREGPVVPKIATRKTETKKRSSPLKTRSGPTPAPSTGINIPKI